MDLIELLAEAYGGKILKTEQTGGNTFVTTLLLPIKESQKCSIYLKQNGDGHIKIGISKNPKQREGTLQSQESSIKLLYSREFPDRQFAVQLEKTLHEIYKYWRIRGEWFNLNQNQVDTCINYITHLKIERADD